VTEPPTLERVQALLVIVGPYESAAICELNEALHALYCADLGAKPIDIAHIEAFWHCADWDFSSAGFVLLLHNGRRAYLDIWVEQVGDDGKTPPKVDIEFAHLPAGQKYPNFPSPSDPIGGWIDDVQTLNIFLRRPWQP
jgi:hypothetical protein